MMHRLLQKEFGFREVKIKKLNGYENENYLITTNTDTYIFKTYPFKKELLDLIEEENRTLQFLEDSDNDKFPQPIPFTDGFFVKILEEDGEKIICRMLSFIDGEFLGDIKQTKRLFESFGVFLAQLDIALKKHNSYTIMARQWEWDIQYLSLYKKYINDIPSAKDRTLVSYFFQQFEEFVTPQLPELRKQIIHNDANEWNVLVKNGKVSGIIDFGDLAHSLLINELAVAITYACYNIENPLEWTSIILKSYHSKFPIEEKEIKILYYLIAARLSLSVCNSAHARKINPGNTSAFVSEKLAWRMLYRWLRISPIAAENIFRLAIGLPEEKLRSADKMIEERHRYISPILSLTYDTPVYIVKSAFQYMYDAYGNTILDAYNNIPHVGHSHPKIVAAGQRQMAKLNTNTRYLYDLLNIYAKKLLSKFPPSLSKVYFVNSGSAASDLAIRMAFTHSRNKRLMVMEHGYHGHTQIGTDISDYKFNNQKGQGQKSYILKTQIPDTYRGKYRGKEAGEKYAKEAIKQIEISDLPIAAFISEPIVGCAGQVTLADGYLKEVYPVIRKHGGVCISDEVQTGFGRLGDYFWGFEAHDVVPDMVIIGKPMGNGHPMGAVVTTSELANSFSKGVEFFSSFGGNPVSCAIGLSVLEVIEEEGLQENAKTVGDYYKSLLLNLQKKYKCIGDVRGSGLFIGVEIVKDDSLKPDTRLAQYIKNELKNQNILISTDGPHDSVLKSKPPLCFTKENAKKVVDTIDELLVTYYGNALS